MTEPLSWLGLLLIVGSSVYIIGFIFTLWLNLNIGPVSVGLAIWRALVWPVRLVWRIIRRPRYIKSGDAIFLYGADDWEPTERRVTIEGWGKYAAVRVGAGAIRRDLIRRDPVGNWFYRYKESRLSG